ncbi:MAG: serine/threonine protein kinase [Deltaproteobacteria bacterium]|nr:serine/threonine protein kinase [Deltaproteobacteria bacterium]
MKYGRYEIEKELGRGAMGVVFQAHDPQIDRRVALKVLRPDRVTSEDFAQRFLKEARAIGRLSHPHIVTVYDVGHDQGTVYIAMEFLDGRPLDEIMREKPLNLKDIVDICTQVAQSLDYAHGQGIVHRDIKPSNIMLASDCGVKITDFGIARIEDPAAAQLTQAGEILGTPTYMSPEQVKGQAVDGRSDLYSLGVILYELSTGRKPFTGKNIAAIFTAITGEAPEDPMASEPFVARGGSRALSKLILKCLSKAPEDRFQSGKSMIQALSSCLEQNAGENVEKMLPKKTGKAGWYAAVAGCILVAMTGFFWFQSRLKAPVTLPAPISEPKPTPDGLGSTGKTTSLPGADTQLPAAVKPVLLSVLNVSSNPSSAQVFIDGSFKGNTPLKLDLPVGKYEVRVSLADYYEWEAQVHLKDPGELPLFARLISMK